MRIAIVGPGAIGTLFGAYMKAGGIDVILIDHNPKRARMIDSGPVVVWSETGSFSVRLRCVADASAVSDAQYVFLAVKSYSTESAAAFSADHARSSYIVSLQNGLGNLEILSRYFERKLIIAGSTGEASTYLRPGEVFHAAVGITKIAPLTSKSNAAARFLVKLLRKAGIRSMLSANAEEMIWEKLIINSSINPVTAVTGMTNGDVVRYEGLRGLVSEIAKETFNVALAKGIQMHLTNPAQTALAVARATATNKSSMLQDIERGKRTEVDSINGALYLEARKLGVPAPLNATMYAMIKSIEEKSVKTFHELEPPILLP